ncbi:GNAT family N-acetyltransferase [Paucibacter soli]|uniref:GNAT family N-acetyltransferase n=1 Tax=Paucibacter soli TaxID=3133433 RepID=UPI0030B3837D
MTNYQLSLSDVADEATRLAIVAPLRAYNEAQAGPGNYQPLVITIQDGAGQIVGGLWGSTGYGWLYTQLLAVPEHLRGQGMGSKLLLQAEAEARSRGCVGSWLDTFSFQARGFYEGLGYKVFGEIGDYPPGGSRCFMSKRLDGGL